MVVLQAGVYEAHYVMQTYGGGAYPQLNINAAPVPFTAFGIGGGANSMTTGQAIVTLQVGDLFTFETAFTSVVGDNNARLMDISLVLHRIAEAPPPPPT
jgi:hypothetical protein